VLVARVQILDVGAGRGRDFGPDAYVVALDISEAALALNTSADEKIVADLETHELPRNRFDRIVCNDVLEHLRNPRAAISNMASALKVSGVLELGFPDVTSRKARISKLTPHWFHVWVYRKVFRFPHAGDPGYGPYRTCLSRDLRPDRLLPHVRRLGLVVESFDRETGQAFRGRRVLSWLAGGATEYTLVLRKPGL
jgi:SAM-dependent methyltransferase